MWKGWKSPLQKMVAFFTFDTLCPKTGKICLFLGIKLIKTTKNVKNKLFLEIKIDCFLKWVDLNSSKWILLFHLTLF